MSPEDLETAWEQVHHRLDDVGQRSRELARSATGLSGKKNWTGATLQARSSNPKLAPQRSEEARSGRNRYVPTGPFCASTYVSIAATCPDSCSFKEAGCYARAGAQHLTMGQLDRGAHGKTGLDVTLEEADLIDATYKRGVPQKGRFGGLDLRLHVGGDVSCEEGARALAGAAERWRARGGGVVWTYTHRWREIPRSAWGGINVWASVERPSDAGDAGRLGYQVAIVVPSFPDGRGLFTVKGLPFTAVACPWESGAGKTCVECRLCLDGDLRGRGQVIAFAVHGADSDKARKSLNVLQESA